MKNILGIETSCDETSVAVVKNGRQVISNVVSSQVEFHKKYGGIVPEIASRKHIEVINALIEQALDEAKLKLKNIDAIAVTYGPGLVGALIVGICTAQALSLVLKKPLIPVNHLEGHIYANFLDSKGSKCVIPVKTRLAARQAGIHVIKKTWIPHQAVPAGRQVRDDAIAKPFITLIVSGGHTSIVLVKNHGQYEILGRTRDDAAGEAFDKVARFLGLGYPGGPIIDDMSKQGDPQAIAFPRVMQQEEHGYDFSFSGLKTAVVNFVKKHKLEAANSFAGHSIEDLVASFQQAVVDVLLQKTIRAAKDKNIKIIALAGGVSANSCLRNAFVEAGKVENIKIIIPPKKFCTDNAAMIAAAAFFNKERRIPELKAVANLSF